MQGSDLNSPVIPQRLLAAEQQQISPGIEQLILKAGKRLLICFYTLGRAL